MPLWKARRCRVVTRPGRMVFSRLDGGAELERNRARSGLVSSSTPVLLPCHANRVGMAAAVAPSPSPVCSTCTWTPPTPGPRPQVAPASRYLDDLLDDEDQPPSNAKEEDP